MSKGSVTMINCGIVNPNFRALTAGIEHWAESSKNEKIFNDPYEAAFKLAKSNFNMELKHLMYVKDLTSGQVQSYLARLNELTVSAKGGKLDNRFAETFWRPSSAFGPRDPVMGSLLNNMQRSQFKLRANEVEDGGLLKATHSELKNEALRQEFSRTGIARADREMNKLEEDTNKAFADFKTAEKRGDEKGRKEANNRILKIHEKTRKLIKRSHLKIYDDFIKIIETQIPVAVQGKFLEMKNKAYDKKGRVVDSKLASQVEKYEKGERVLKLSKDDMARLIKNPDGTEVSDNVYRALTSYTDLMERMYHTLRNGVEKRIQSVTDRLTYLGKMDSADVEAMNNLKENMRNKYMPKYENGFFPHYVKDLNAEFMDGLMDSFDQMQRTANGFDKKSKRSIREIVKDMSLYVDKHSQRRAKDLETGAFGYNYSRNFFKSVNNYVSDINRFNYISFMDAHMLEGLTSIERIFKTNGSAKGYAQNLVDYISDMHLATNGDHNVSDKTRAWMRSVLGVEFISKLGINPRAAARNWFQRLLDYVEWGPLQIKKGKEYLRTQSLGKEGVSAENYIDSVLKDNGLLFAEVSPEFLESQLQAPSSTFKVIQWNNDAGKFESRKKLRIEKIADGISVVAGKASWLHRKAENSNRKSTFKIAYAQMHSWLNIPQYRADLSKAGKSPAEVEASIRRAAENYAVRMVIMNHFDYADYAKSKMLRSKAGRFLGQFQHYSFEFFERNMKIYREAKYDLKQGHMLPGGDAQGLAKAYRMGLAYFLAPVIASVITGVDFSNLIEHDTAQRLNQLATLFTGDEDEIAEAFYGKGPIIATFGGPVTSDLIDIGVMLDLINLEEGDYLTLISGLEKYDPYAQSSDITKKIRLLNTFAGRAVERHIPQLMEGRIGWAVQQEFGLYPTAKARKAKKKLKKARKEILPRDIEAALQQLEGKPKSFAKGGQFITEGPETIEPIPKSKGPAKYNEFDMKNLDTALAELDAIKKREDEEYVPNRKLSLGGPDPDDY